MDVKNKIVKAHDLSFQKYLSEEKIAERIAALGQEIAAEYENKNPLFIAVLNGAFVFAADLMRACGDLACEVSFVKLSSYDGLASSGKVETILGLDTSIEGREIIVIEDIVDTGKTLFQFLQHLAKFNPVSISLASLLVKPDAIQYHFPIAYVGFNIPNKFVVGYGLDYNGAGRNFSAIYQLIESPVVEP
ncbi:MAG: hypoxanthine phosphoribosyltransferase [Saprospiraceae bacterium]